MVDVDTAPLISLGHYFFQCWHFFAPFFHFFSGEKRFVFFLSANIYDAFMYLMACWFILGHSYHIYFPDYPLVPGSDIQCTQPPFFSRTYTMRPCFFVVTAHTIPVILFMVCFWHILVLHRSLIQFIRIAAGQNWRDIDQHFSDIFFFLVLTAALCVRSSDIIAVIGITFTCILKCCFGQD